MPNTDVFGDQTVYMPNSIYAQQNLKIFARLRRAIFLTNTFKNRACGAKRYICPTVYMLNRKFLIQKVKTVYMPNSIYAHQPLYCCWCAKTEALEW